MYNINCGSIRGAGKRFFFLKHPERLWLDVGTGGSFAEGNAAAA